MQVLARSQSDSQTPELPPVYTIGHSTRTIPEFVKLLNLGQVRTVVDIRTVPRSRTNPQFNLDALPETLAVYDIEHVQIAELGGLRAKSHTVAAAVNGFWTNRSFHNYADYALSEEFRSGLSRLMDLSRGRQCAIMCAEAVWWRCHRRIVADHLLCRGHPVFHLLGKARIEPAKLNAAAQCDGDTVTYPMRN
jgi:uncharacterized protein (DUF488 family)